MHAMIGAACLLVVAVVVRWAAASPTAAWPHISRDRGVRSNLSQCPQALLPGVMTAWGLLRQCPAVQVWQAGDSAGATWSSVACRTVFGLQPHAQVAEVPIPCHLGSCRQHDAASLNPDCIYIEVAEDATPSHVHAVTAAAIQRARRRVVAVVQGVAAVTVAEEDGDETQSTEALRAARMQQQRLLADRREGVAAGRGLLHWGVTAMPGGAAEWCTWVVAQGELSHDQVSEACTPGRGAPQVGTQHAHVLLVERVHTQRSIRRKERPQLERPSWIQG